MNCFDNIIGVEGCNGSTSTSGLYINGVNGIAGINIKTASNSADSETISGYELLKGCISNATIEIINLATSELSKFFQFNTVIETYKYTNYAQIPQYTDNPPAFLLSDLISYDTYIKYYIDSLIFQSTDTQAAVLTINGTNYPINLVANTPYTFNVNASFSSLNISLVGTNIMYNTSFFDGYIQTRCDEEYFWCMYKKELAPAIRYLAATLFFEEVISSDRYNLTTLNNESVKTNYELNNNKFKVHLSSAIQKIKNSLGNNDSICLSCNSLSYKYAMP